jgi:hypothetical protein
MWMDAGWLVGEMRVVESLLRSAWDEDSKRVQPGESAGEVMAEELESAVFLKTARSLIARTFDS